MVMTGFDFTELLENMRRVLKTISAFDTMNIYISSLPQEPKYPFLALIMRGTLKHGNIGQHLDACNMKVIAIFAQTASTSSIAGEKFAAFHKALYDNPTLNDVSGNATISAWNFIEFQELSALTLSLLGESVVGWEASIDISVEWNY